MIMTPDNWDYVEEWNDYFRRRINNELNPNDGIGYFGRGNIGSDINILKKNGIKTIWIPGCGLSLLPNILSKAGFDVFATDTSSVVVEYQNSDKFDLKNVDIAFEESLNKSTANCEVHDLRDTYKPQSFDLIINSKAFQRFSYEDMRSVAKTHYNALRGKEAIFIVHNCQGTVRDNVEQSLVDAGFFVPFYEIDKQFRKSLNETNIPYALILGRPRIPQYDQNGNKVEQWGDEEWRLSSKKILREITKEFEDKRKVASRDEEEKYLLVGTKYANIIYNSG